MSNTKQEFNNIRNIDINENIVGDKKIVNIIKNITKEPKRLTDKEINKLKEETQRPYLKHRLGERITCYGYLIGKYRNTKFYTVINLVDDKGKYITDHVQLNLKTDEFEYNERDVVFIKFKGVVKEYIRKSDNSKDYEIDLIEKPIVLSEIYYNMNNTTDYYSKEFNEDKIFDYISTIEVSKLYELINKLKQLINNLTTYDFGENFIYSFIINQYMLNTATYELYNGSVNNIKISEDAILQILILISSVFYILNVSDRVSLTFIFEYICFVCNKFQGVEYTKKSNPKFETFCKNKLNIKNSQRKIDRAWSVIKLRQLNFGNNPNPGDFKFDEVLNMAYSVLNDYI